MKLIALATFYEPVSAWIALNKLNAAGVRAVLENENVLQNDWTLGEAIGQIRLLVAEGEAENALIILEQKPEQSQSELDAMAMDSEPEEIPKPLFNHFYTHLPDDGNGPYDETSLND